MEKKKSNEATLGSDRDLAVSDPSPARIRVTWSRHAFSAQGPLLASAVLPTALTPNSKLPLCSLEFDVIVSIIGSFVPCRTPDSGMRFAKYHP